MRNMWRSRVARRDLSEREHAQATPFEVADVGCARRREVHATRLCRVAPETVTRTDWRRGNRRGHVLRRRRRRAVTGERGTARDLPYGEREESGRRTRPRRRRGLVAAAVIRPL